MIVLATGSVSARTDHDRVIATVQSGGSKVELSLSFNRACRLANEMLQQAVVTLDASRENAAVLPFKRKR